MTVMRMDEEWWAKAIGLNGDYWISTSGTVVNLKTNHVLTPFISNRGYYRVFVCSDEGKRLYRRVHRLVLESFVLNPDNLPQVNHKDENKLNNYIANLEWCTNQYNQNYGTAMLRSSLKRLNGSRSKAVSQFDLDNNLIKTYPSTMEAQRQTGITNVAIGFCCRGNCKAASGYIWKYI